MDGWKVGFAGRMVVVFYIHSIEWFEYEYVYSSGQDSVA